MRREEAVDGQLVGLHRRHEHRNGTAAVERAGALGFDVAERSLCGGDLNLARGALNAGAQSGGTKLGTRLVAQAEITHIGGGIGMPCCHLELVGKRGLQGDVAGGADLGTAQHTRQRDIELFDGATRRAIERHGERAAARAGAEPQHLEQVRDVAVGGLEDEIAGRAIAEREGALDEHVGVGDAGADVHAEAITVAVEIGVERKGAEAAEVHARHLDLQDPRKRGDRLTGDVHRAGTARLGGKAGGDAAELALGAGKVGDAGIAHREGAIQKADVEDDTVGRFAFDRDLTGADA